MIVYQPRVKAEAMRRKTFFGYVRAALEDLDEKNLDFDRNELYVEDIKEIVNLLFVIGLIRKLPIPILF